MPLDEHVLAADASHDPGCITKCVGSAFKKHHGSYRRNGYDETVGDAAKKAVYEVDFTVASEAQRLPKKLVRETKSGGGGMRTPKNPRRAKTAWWFKGQNFKVGYLPYNHDSHHILPWDALKNALTDPQGMVLQKSGYNVNDKHNVIILPKTFEYGRALKLLTHCGDHPSWTQAVITTINEAMALLNPKPGHRINEANKGKVRKMFEDWSKVEFWSIVQYGEVAYENDAPMEIDCYSPSSAM
jgi:hypothetical protein